MAEQNQLDPQSAAVIAALSHPRLTPYLAATKGNEREALKLYQWNIDISGATYEALHMFEVFLRNAIDTELRTWNRTQNDKNGRQHTSEWLLDPARLLKRLVGANIERAKTQAQAAKRGQMPSGAQLTHDDVLAQLSFGTWRYLLPDRDPGRQRLWIDALHRAFPNLSGTPHDLTARVDSAYRLRNRVAHLEPLLRPTLLRTEIAGMRWVLNAINPQLEQWFNSRQRITQSIRRRTP